MQIIAASECNPAQEAELYYMPRVIFKNSVNDKKGTSFIQSCMSALVIDLTALSVPLSVLSPSHSCPSVQQDFQFWSSHDCIRSKRIRKECKQSLKQTRWEWSHAHLQMQVTFIVALQCTAIHCGHLFFFLMYVKTLSSYCISRNFQISCTTQTKK